MQYLIHVANMYRPWSHQIRWDCFFFRMNQLCRFFAVSKNRKILFIKSTNLERITNANSHLLILQILLLWIGTNVMGLQCKNNFFVAQHSAVWFFGRFNATHQQFTQPRIIFGTLWCGWQRPKKKKKKSKQNRMEKLGKFSLHFSTYYVDI